MARTARTKSTFGTYYIHQHGGGTRPLFLTDEDRLRFLKILEKTKKKFDYKLYAFCLKDPNAYHLVLFDNGGDISKIMKSINISYAMYAKCEGPLFKDRYKSRLLQYRHELSGITELLQKNAGLGQWNNYCSSTMESKDTFNLLDQELYLQETAMEIAIHPEELQDSDDHCEAQESLGNEGQNCIECMDDAKEKLSQECLRQGIAFEEMLRDKPLRNTLILRIRRNSTLSLKALGELFGGLSESTICKLLNQMNEPR